MSSHSRGSAIPSGLYSKSTPNLPTLRTFDDETQREYKVASPLRSAARPSPSPLSPASNSALSETPSGEDYQDDYDYEDEEEEEGFVVEGVEGESSDDNDDDDDNDKEHVPMSRGLYTSKSYTHLPQHTHTGTALFPPFYNRPPNPLPPSPSLTSLLRPAFSRPTSRPTTPDSSDVDTSTRAGSHSNGTSTPTSNLASSARHAPTVPRASPKVPTYEYYGFALYLGSSAAFLMYVLWAYVPAPMLHQMGIHYYPNRWWALAVPCWLVVLVIYIYVALASYNTRYLTLPLSSCENLVDECAQIAAVDKRTGQIVRDARQLVETRQQKDRQDGCRPSAPPSRRGSLSEYQFDASSEVDWKSLWSIGTDAVMDVPIGGVCEILYGSDE